MGQGDAPDYGMVAVMALCSAATMDAKFSSMLSITRSLVYIYLHAFNKVQQEVANDVLIFCLKFKRDASIRWSGVFTTIKPALQLEKAITLFCARKQQGTGEDHNLKDDELERFDWEEFHHSKHLFRPFGR
jgi:hypothetical protein